MRQAWVIAFVLFFVGAFGYARERFSVGDLLVGGLAPACFSPVDPPINWFDSSGNRLPFAGGQPLLTVYGLEFLPNGRFLALTRTRLVSMDPADGVIEQFGPTLPYATSFVEDASGNVFVGQSAAPAEVWKLDKHGLLIDKWGVPGVFGPIFVDLDSDQCTLYYASGGDVVGRFDVCRGEPLAPLPQLPFSGAHQVRVLKDQTLLVVQREAIYRLGRDGAILRSYDLPQVGDWTAVSADADAKSFWAVAFRIDTCEATSTTWLFDVDSGAVVRGPVVANGDSKNLLADSIAVFGDSRPAATANIPSISALGLLVLATTLAAVGCTMSR